MSPCPNPKNRKCVCCGKMGHRAIKKEKCKLQHHRLREWQSRNPSATSPYFNSIKNPWTLSLSGSQEAEHKEPAAALRTQPAPHPSLPATGSNSIGVGEGSSAGGSRPWTTITRKGGRPGLGHSPLARHVMRAGAMESWSIYTNEPLNPFNGTIDQLAQSRLYWGDEPTEEGTPAAAATHFS